ncbi:MAG: NAD(P)H-quinone oxidoreductase [Methylotetracoccus sp.]|jgi:putative PIG3 family NAD(P)H quinone oxidoreductase|nr:NAD(P)H-quinone oxidoreductase [Methylotetracoccus sp.]
MPAAETMWAVEIMEPGGPEVLRRVPRPRPVPGDDDVLIRVIAAGVNRPDVMQREGRYPPPPGAPDIPGLEVAGEVVTQGAKVTRPRLGERVCALVTGGGYAEYCAAAAVLCLPIPQGLNPIQAASLPETLFTVWSNVFERGRLRPGERFLVHGGASGIGVAAIQLARAFDATVYATAGSAVKCRFCAELGAAAINYREVDFVDEIRGRTGGQGVDLILDIVGGDYLQRNLNCLAPDGRLVQIGVQQGPKTTINLLPILLKRLTLTGSTLRPRPVPEKALIADALRARVWPLLASGRIKPVVDRTFPLARVADAHRLMESGRHIGKIVLEVAA